MSPLKLFEYMEAKKPIITSNLPAIKEIMSDQVNSILCNPNDFDQWKNAIQKLNTNTSFKRKISINAYKKFKENFTWHLRAKKLLNNLDRTNRQKNITIFNFSLLGVEQSTCYRFYLIN